MKKIRTITLRGVKYKVLWFKDPDKLIDFDGRCNKQDKIIEIRCGLSARDTNVVLIHEIFHAFFWDLDESVVVDTAIDLERVLNQLNK